MPKKTVPKNKMTSSEPFTIHPTGQTPMGTISVVWATWL